MAIHSPVHPGTLIRKDCIEASGLTIGQAAEKLEVTRQALSNLVNEKSALTPEMSLRLERLGWGRAETWVRLQGSYDLARVRASHAAEPRKKRTGRPRRPSPTVS